MSYHHKSKVGLISESLRETFLDVIGYIVSFFAKPMIHFTMVADINKMKNLPSFSCEKTDMLIGFICSSS